MKYDGIKRKDPRPLPKVRKNEPLNLDQLGIIMIVLVFGIVSSILVFLCEVRKTNKSKSGSNEKGDSGMKLRIVEEMDEGGASGERGVGQMEVVEEEIVS